jgi:hypothetical protein
MIARPAERRLLCRVSPAALALLSWPPVRLLVTLCPLLAALAVAGCAARLDSGRSCPKGCEAGRICVAARCRSADESPSPSDTLRVMLEPVDIAVIAAKGPPSSELPETIALGRASNGTVELLLRFLPTFRDDADVVSAFVVLDPIAGAARGARPPTFEMARIRDAWQAATVTWGRQPRLDLPRRTGVVRALSPAPLRIDVTPLVRDWSKRLPDDHGIALLVQGDDAVGQAYSMGTLAGSGPRLEVYVR